MAKSPGVYICSGCGIGDALDTAQLAKVAESEFKVPRCQVHPFLCSPEGVALIRKDLDEGAVDGVVVAACSPRVKTDAFRFIRRSSSIASTCASTSCGARSRTTRTPR